MILKTRKYYFIVITVLVLLLLLWMDEVIIKTNTSILTYKYQIGKILIHTAIAYKASKYITNKLLVKPYFKSIKPKYLFLGIFMLCNSYIILQFTSRTVITKISNYETRKSLGAKLVKTDHSGTGYEGDKLTIDEYEEINRYTNLPELPKEAKDIYVYDWYGMQDYSRIVEFTVKPDFKLKQFFKDSLSLNKIELVKYRYDKQINQTIEYDTIGSKRYKWEVGEI